MKETDVLSALNGIFQNLFDNPQLRVNAATTAADVDGWDSLAHINLVVAIEKHFHVQFALGELQELKNVGDMVKLILSKSSQ